MIGATGSGATRLTLPGLVDEVTIRTDGRGVPYIQASSENDLHLALGYVVARDRLWQMELLRRTAYGELAELLGWDVVEQDAHFCPA